jgi:hypothetical protein
MTTTFTAAFDISSWEEETYDEAPGARLFLIRVGKTFTGEVTGTSTTTLAAAISEASDADAGYGGVERLHVEVAGRGGGTLVLRHAAISSADGASMEVVVVPGTGTGGLAGARGTAHIDRHDDGSHTFTLTLE